MASTGIRLDAETVEKIARRVVELLERRGLQKRELVDAAELAQRFGIERSWVYTRAIELGGVRLGRGTKPRLRFDPEVAAQVLRKVGEVPAADPPAQVSGRVSLAGRRVAGSCCQFAVRGRAGRVLRLRSVCRVERKGR